MTLFCFLHRYQPTAVNSLRSNASHTQRLCNSNMPTKLKITAAILSTQKVTHLQTLAQMGKLITRAGEGEFKWTEARDNRRPV